MASILTDTKAALGLAEDHTAFDHELVMFINSVLSRLTQLGVGPSEGFRIADKQATWEDFVGTDPKLDMIKGYMHMRVKLYFDPPEIGFVLTMMKEQIEKDEYLINLEVEPPAATTTVGVTIEDAFGDPTQVQVPIDEPDTVILDGGGA